MTISSTTNRTVAATNGATTVFPFGYKFLQDQDLVVLKTETSSGAVTTLVLNSDYTVTGAGGSSGGNVTITPALAAGYKITVYRDPEATQELDLVANDSFPAEANETAFDKLTMICQRLKERLARAFIFADGADVTGVGLAVPVPEANKYLAWNGAATALVNVAVATGSVISASTSASGIIELATQAEVDTGADAVRAVTPATLAGSALATRVTAAESAIAASLSGPNLLVNGDFSVAQAPATNNLDGAYSGVDQWYSLSGSSANSAFVQDLNPEAGYSFALAVPNGALINQSFGFAQVVESVLCRHTRGRDVTLSGRLKFTDATTVHYAILAHTGTADSVTRDIVNNWASVSYTAGGFFIAANLSVVAKGSVVVAADTYTDLTDLTGTVPAGANNLFVMVWATAQSSATKTIRTEFLKLELGSVSTPFIPRPFDAELALAKRYYQQSFDYGTAPAQNIGTGKSEARFPQVVAASTAKKGDQIRFPVEMRADPTTLTTYSPAAATVEAYNITQAAACTATAVVDANAKGFSLEYTTPAATSAGQAIGVHWSAVARL